MRPAQPVGMEPRPPLVSSYRLRAGVSAFSAVHKREPEYPEILEALKRVSGIIGTLKKAIIRHIRHHKRG